jgi:hypothetical protein
MAFLNDDDDVPWADPVIQTDYEAALGSFLVRFNRLENLIGDLLEASLAKHGRADLYFSGDRLELKLRQFEIVLLALPGMHKPDCKAAAQLNGERNTLAHGHFDQNPYSGDYKIVTQRRKHVDMPVVTIRRLSLQTDRVIDDFRSCEAYLAFVDLPELG